jgi:predicted enzyme related to lactoylglutathione lyase
VSTTLLKEAKMEHFFCHFELPAEDPSRAQAFYEQVFNWKFDVLDMGEQGKYHMFSSGERGCGGGIYKKCPDWGKPLNYIYVEDIPGMIEKVTAHGGKMVFPKTPIPGHGFMAIVEDTEGNALGLWSKE